MSKITDPISGKEYQSITITDLSSSLAAAADNRVDGRIHEFIGIDKIPSRLKQGDQSKFVDLDKVVTGSIIRDTERGITYIPFKKVDFQEMTIGDTREGKKGQVSFVSQSFSPRAYNQISASFANKFKNVNDDTLITFLAEEFYTATTEGFVGPVTASFRVFTPDGLTASFSGIGAASDGGYDMTLDFSNSNFVTNTFITFPPGGEANTLRTSTFIPKFQHKFVNRGGNYQNRALITSSLASINGILGVDASATGSPSGSNCGVGQNKFINGTDDSSGTYAFNGFKGRVGGDADSGSLAAINDDLLDSFEYIIYPFGTVVASGSFRYQPNLPSTFASTAAFKIATTGSSDIRTLFYISGSNNGPSGSHTGSGIFGVSAATQLGSPAHADPLLRTTASYGFYNPIGTQDIYHISSSTIHNSGGSLGNVVMKVPRFLSTHP